MQIDGIKKISKEEIAESRKIVLKTIEKDNSFDNGEKKEKDKNDNKGLFKNFFKKKSVKKDVLLNSEQIKNQAEKDKRELLRQAKNKEDIEKSLKKKIKKETKGEEEDVKKEETEEKEENFVLVDEKNKLNFFSKIDYKKSFKKSLAIMISFFSVFLLFYFLFVFLILKFKISSDYTKKISQYLFVPALFSSYGVIDYDHYNILKKDLAEKNIVTDKEIKLEIVKSLIKKDLFRKYGLENEKNLEVLREKFVTDAQINQVSQARIKRIKGMILEEDLDFVFVGRKNGDEFGQVTINEENKELFTYYDDVKNLLPSEYSEIVNTVNGYYFFQSLSSESQELSLNYIFVKSISLDDYIDRQIDNYQLWSFAD